MCVQRGPMWANVGRMITQAHPRTFDRVGLRHRREDAGFSVAALAAATGLSKDGLYKIEQGRRRPRPSTYRRLIHCLRLSDGDLWVRTDASAGGQ